MNGNRPTIITRGRTSQSGGTRSYRYGYLRCSPRCRRTVQTLLVVVMAALCLLSGVALWLYHSTPAYWVKHRRFIDEVPPERLEAMAREFEARVLRIHRYRGPVPPLATGDGGAAGQAVLAVRGERLTRTIRLPVDQANAWLATRLSKWLKNQNWQLPDQISLPMIHVRHQKLILAFQWESLEISNVFSVIVSVAMSEDGMLHLPRQWVCAGRLPVPYFLLWHHLKKRSTREKRQLFEELATLVDGRAIEPVIPHTGDATRNMQLRLHDVRLNPDLIELRLKLEPVPDEIVSDGQAVDRSLP